MGAEGGLVCCVQVWESELQSAPGSTQPLLHWRGQQYMCVTHDRAIANMGE